MIKLAKYLKPFIVFLLLAVALLFGQAMCDLNLPNLMSDIVNVGIMQNGEEHSAPRALSLQGMAFVQTYMNDEEKTLVDAHYQRVSSDVADASGKTYASLYPAAAGTELYVRAELSEDTQAALDDAFSTAEFSLVLMMMEQMEQVAPASAADSTQLPKIDLKEIYALQQSVQEKTAAAMQALSPEEREQSAAMAVERMKTFHDNAANTDAMIRASVGATFASAFYADLGGDVVIAQRNYIVRMGLVMLLVALLGGLATILVSLISSKVATGVAQNLRSDIFRRVSEFSSSEFDKFSTASLITRTTNDITQIQMLLLIGIRMICYAPIMAVGGVIMAVQESVSMAWIIAAACAVLLGLIFVVFAIAVPKFKSIQKLVDKLNLVSRENLSGMLVIRAFGTQEFEKNRFAAANQDLTKTNLFINRVMVTMMPIMMLVMNGVSLLIVWNGAHQIADSALRIGDMMAFMQYAMQVIMSFLMISMMFIFVPRAAVAAARIAEVLESKPSVVDPPHPKSFDETQRGVVTFDHVGFRYSGAEEDALEDISFTSLPGQMTAFIGSTGSGKSTIASLLLRFYDVTKGHIRVSGADVREVTMHDLRQRIGYVPQKAELLSGTIASNLRYGAPEATDEDLRVAATVAQAISFIDEKEHGMDADIAQGGANVSGGQKQRLSIARALAKKPDVFIFDDSFSALDFKTDRALREALKAHTGHSTMLVVAQRVSTIMGADQIIVLEEGHIVGKGTHSELLKTCPAYYEIASSQLTKEELA